MCLHVHGLSPSVVNTGQDLRYIPSAQSNISAEIHRHLIVISNDTCCQINQVDISIVKLATVQRKLAQLLLQEKPDLLKIFTVATIFIAQASILAVILATELQRFSWSRILEFVSQNNLDWNGQKAKFRQIIYI